LMMIIIWRVGNLVWVGNLCKLIQSLHSAPGIETASRPASYDRLSQYRRHSGTAVTSYLRRSYYCGRSVARPVRLDYVPDRFENNSTSSLAGTCYECSAARHSSKTGPVVPLKFRCRV
jgi:hypothetical protein